MASWYDHPQYFDMVFRDETASEVKFFEQAFSRFADGAVRRLLEPGCGSGRLVAGMAAKGYDTCPMEGYDSKRLKQVLGLPATVEINMVVSCGIRKEEGIYGERFRVPFEKVYHKH